MGSFKRALLGYRRQDVDAAMAGQARRLGEMEREFNARRSHLEVELRGRDERIGALERELSYLSGIGVERERAIRALREDLAAANSRHESSLASLHTVTERLDELYAQARGQATRIRMRALEEAAQAGGGRATAGAGERRDAGVNGNGSTRDLFQGRVQVEIGPLGDFSQLVGFEDAAGQIGGTSDISVERFSEGRATLSMRLEEPVDLLRELEERSPLGFRVRKNGGDRLVLDVGEDTESQRRAA
jgi:hypothetical protein